MSTEIVISITMWAVGLLIVRMGGFYAFVLRMKDDHSKVCERVGRLEEANKVFWKVLEPHFAGIIHSPDHAIRDNLVDKLVKGTLSQEDAVILVPLLQDSIDHSESTDKKLASIFLLARVMVIVATGAK